MARWGGEVLLPPSVLGGEGLRLPVNQAGLDGRPKPGKVADGFDEPEEEEGRGGPMAEGRKAEEEDVDGGLVERKALKGRCVVGVG